MKRKHLFLSNVQKEFAAKRDTAYRLVRKPDKNQTKQT